MRGKKNYLLVMVLTLLSLTGCKTVKFVPVPEYHTLYKTRVDTVQRLDSVYFRDSVFMAAKGDTVFLTKTQWRERFRNVYHIKADTVMQLDSIRVSYPVEKQLTKWERWKIDMGGWAMGVAAVLVILVILKVTKIAHKIFV
ncbi:hypothetical protein LK429_00315 [Hoylesella buccalis]|jgi:hypothetical protein|uniref:hypothetical protein n=1 Tax=Hoylesella buccalis TaxID=28127 RepID=UPI001D14A210|nr:hypothetical protein [Hoylesella buccalis]UEA63069.1 hypothetical protein LK429_00315 [Hoylesella buccalis]UWP49641.1 hypothetical protein NQ518_00800 [Hoylesella buccalis ATCC 35310]